MDTMGRHIIAELWDCNPEKLNDMEYVERLFDVFTCGDRIDPAIAAHYIADGLDAKIRENVEIPRGMGPVEVPAATVQHVN